jgi:hypothetical protein
VLQSDRTVERKLSHLNTVCIMSHRNGGVKVRARRQPIKVDSEPYTG